jgi:mannose-6-phosphate isomerase-like protein (cupin superfamily)
LRLEPWDTIEIPPGVSRGFRNVGEAPAMPLGIVGGREPGMVNWPDAVARCRTGGGRRVA